MKKLLALLLLIPGIVFAQDQTLVGPSPLIQGTTDKIKIHTLAAKRIELLTNIDSSAKGFYVDGSTGNLTSVGGASLPTALTFTSLIGSGATPTILGGTVGLNIRNNADNASNIAITDAGLVTLRNQLAFSTADTISAIASTAATGVVYVSGGTNYNASNGGVMSVRGNSASGNPGRVRFDTGTASGADIIFNLNSDGDFTVVSGGNGNGLQVNDTGTVTTVGTFTSSRTTDLGWTLVSAANQACNTTCTSACVVGQETTSKAFLACTDATADVCLCAGAS